MLNINNFQNFTPQQAKEVNALVLAFLGDAVYSLMAREFLVKHNTEKAGALNRKATKMVRASAQAVVFDLIKNSFDENEQNVANRAKNIHTSNIPKTSNLEEYKKATSLEAVVGYNYLIENQDRINKIFILTEKESL